MNQQRFWLRVFKSFTHCEYWRNYCLIYTYRCDACPFLNNLLSFSHTFTACSSISQIDLFLGCSFDLFGRLRLDSRHLLTILLIFVDFNFISGCNCCVINLSLLNILVRSRPLDLVCGNALIFSFLTRFITWIKSIIGITHRLSFRCELLSFLLLWLN